MSDYTADWLVGLYGPNPQQVGIVDGTEDDYGDLLGDALVVLGVNADEFSDEKWRIVQDAAHDSTAITMETWLADIRKVL